MLAVSVSRRIPTDDIRCAGVLGYPRNGCRVGGVGDLSPVPRGAAPRSLTRHGLVDFETVSGSTQD